MIYVPDAQTALAWHFSDEATPETNALLDVLSADGLAVVPTLFHYEVANVLVCDERRRTPRGDAAHSTAFLEDLRQLPIETDEASTGNVALRTVELARQHRLTVYDAAYLELAMRRGLPLATRDKALADAAKAAGVKLLL